MAMIPMRSPRSRFSPSLRQHKIIPCRAYRCISFIAALGFCILLLGGYESESNLTSSNIQRLKLREAEYPERQTDHAPILSIMTSVFQGDEFLEGFLEDITNQTIFSRCELLLAQNDAPSDKAANIIRSYLDRFSNIKLIIMPRTELYTVWNTLIDTYVTGKYITNANVDDRKRADSLEVQVKYLEANDKYDLAATGVRVTNKPNVRFEDCVSCTEWFVTKKPKELQLRHLFRYDTQQRIIGSQNIPHNAPVWRASIHSKQGGFRQEFSPYSDYEFWLRTLTSGHKMVLLPAVTNLYLINEQSYGRTVPAKFSTSDVAPTEDGLDGIIRTYSSKLLSLRKLNILIIHERIPNGYEGGDRRLWSIVEHLHGLGHQLYFIFRKNNSYESEATEARLRAMGCPYVVGDMKLSTLPQLIQDVQPRIDLSILPLWFWFDKPNRPKPTIPELAVPILTEKSPKTRNIIYTDDIHYERKRNSPDSGYKEDCIERLAQREIEIYRKAKTLLTISREDADTVRKLIGESARTVIDVLPYTEQVIDHATKLAYEERSGIIYIGTPHSGNIQAVTYILEKVWPELQKRDPNLTLTLMGANIWEQLAKDVSGKTGISNVKTFGKVEEPLNFLRTSLLFLNPVIIGSTGVSTKNFFAMAHGVPVVTNSKGQYGMCQTESCQAIKIADDPIGMADAVMDVIGTREKWENASKSTYDHAVRNFGHERLGSENALTVAIRKLVLEK